VRPQARSPPLPLLLADSREQPPLAASQSLVQPAAYSQSPAQALQRWTGDAAAEQSFWEREPLAASPSLVPGLSRPAAQKRRSLGLHPQASLPPETQPLPECLAVLQPQAHPRAASQPPPAQV